MIMQYTRIRNRGVDFTESHWQQEYKFSGIAYPQYDQIEELDADGRIVRIHIMSHCRPS